MKKFLYFCMFLFVFTCTIVGCSCNDEETPEEKLLRLYDCNKNGVIDYWEEPYNYEMSNEQTDVNKSFVDTSGKVIDSINYINNADDMANIPSLANNKSNITLAFRNGIYFNRSEDQKIACQGFRAYIVYIYTAQDLVNFAKSNLSNFDNEKYILYLENNLDFRKADGSFGEQYMINLNGATIYGNGKTIEGFKLVSNNSHVITKNTDGTNVAINGYKQYDSDINNDLTNLKYAIISNATAVYDLNIYMGLNLIDIVPETVTQTGEGASNINCILDVSPLRNCGIVENVNTRGYLGVTTNITTTDTIDSSNMGISMNKVNVSGILTEEDPAVNVANDTDWVVNCEYKPEESVTPEDEYSYIYDYDRLIYTSRVVDTENSTEEQLIYKYVYNYGNLIRNKNIHNCVSELAIHMTEKDETGKSYNPCVEFNFGGAVANKIELDNTIKNVTINIPTLSIVSGGDVNVGGIISTATNSMFIESCKANLGSSEEKLTINSIGKNFSNIGGVVGYLEKQGEVKSCNSEVYIKFVGGNNLEVAEGDESRYSNVSIGGVAGVNNSMLISNKTVGNIEIENAYIASTGALAGSAKNSAFIKNISDIDVNINNCYAIYSSTAVGSMLGGYISNSAVEYTSNIYVDQKGANFDSTLDSNNNYKLATPFVVNSGLLYFHSSTYIDIMDEMIAENNGTSINTIDNLNDTLYTFDENKIYTYFGDFNPYTYKNLVKDNTKIDYLVDLSNSSTIESEEGTGGSETTTEKPLPVLGAGINLGGYHLYSLGATSPIQDNLYYLGSNNVLTNNNQHLSTLHINNSEEINYKILGEDEEQNVITVTTSKNFYTNKDNLRNTKLSIAEVDNLNIDSIRIETGINGINQQLIAELDTVDHNNVLTFKNLYFNDVYPGRYLSPDRFTDIQMADKTIYADLRINSFEELKYILNNYLSGATDIVRRDLFKNLLFRIEDMFSLGNIGTNNYYQLNDLNLIQENGTGEKRYETDINNNFKLSSTYVYKSDANEVEELLEIQNIESVSEDIVYLKRLSDNAICAIKESKLDKKLVGTKECYEAPEGFEIIGNVYNPTDAKELDYTPFETILTWYFCKIEGIKYIAINKIYDTINKYYITEFTLVSKDSNSEQEILTKYVLQSMSETNPSYEPNGFYLLYNLAVL